MQFQALYITLSLALLHKVTAEGGYSSTCNSIGLLGPVSNAPCYTIVANCQFAGPKGGDNVATMINLGNCFGNQDGTLVPEQGYNKVFTFL
jgi:hypothetical protein